MIAVVAAVTMICFNINHGTIKQVGASSVLLGTAIAFSCGLVAIGVDLQDSVTARLGALANTSILQSWQGWAGLLGWGSVQCSHVSGRAAKSELGQSNF